VLDEQEGNALVAQLEDPGHQNLHERRVDPCARLIQEDDLGAGRENPGQFQQPTERKFLCGHSNGSGDEFQVCRAFSCNSFLLPDPVRPNIPEVFPTKLGYTITLSRTVMRPKPRLIWKVGEDQSGRCYGAAVDPSP
jgi:hypothetical protein